MKTVGRPKNEMRNFATSIRNATFLWPALLCFLFLFFAVGPAFAVDPTRQISQYGHTAWRVQDGLFSGTPNAITQTADGYLWIGTLAGVVRFDGVQFVPGTTSQGQPLPEAKITSLLGARDGSLWIGTSIGLSRLKDGELLNYSNTPVGISSIIQDHEGTIWVTRYKVTDGKGPLCRAVDKELQCYGKADGIPVGYAVGLAEDSLGNLWIGSHVLVRWREGSSQIYFEEELKHLKESPGVLDIAAGPSGSLWAALEGAGPELGVRHFVDGKWTSYAAEGFDGALVRTHNVFLDRDNALWIGTESEGIYRIYDGKADHYRRADGLSGDSVNGFYQDREGNLWVATDGGVDIFRDTPVISFSMREGLSTASNHSIVASRDGSIWIGNDGSLDVLRNGKVSTIKAGQGLPGAAVNAMFEDYDGGLWLGIDEKLMIYKDDRFIEIKQPDGSALGAGGRVLAITEDIDHNICAMVQASTRHLFRIKDQKVQEEIPLTGLPYPTWLAADPEGGLWIGSYSNKLGRYRNGQMEIISLGHDEKSLTIECLLAEPGGTVWAATSHGLFKWKDGQSKVLDTQNGLPCDLIFSVIKDDAGSFWLYTQCGLLNIAASELENWWEHPESKVDFRLFGPLDGVQPGRVTAQLKVSKSPDGRLWFVNSVVAQMINPGRFYRNSTQPPVHIEGVIADNKSYLPQENLRLPALTRDVQIDYTALSFTVPQKVRFRYKLEGHDTNWEEPGTRRQAFYTNLGPGTYSFRVIACNNDGVWNDVGATLSFTIAPAWYQTNWFRLLMVLTGLFIVWLLYRLRVRQIARVISARFDERLAERTRMARELHDTFLQTIQGSKMVADDALEQSDDPVRLRRTMEQLSLWLAQAVDEGRAALNSLRTSTTEKNDLASAFQRATDACLIQGNMVSTFSVVGETRDMHPIVRDEVYRIGYEAIRNACAHSGASQLVVELRYEQDLIVRVKDNGKGMDPAIVTEGKDGHFGLQGMRERAMRIEAKLTLDSSATSGTEITLVVPGDIAFRMSKRLAGDGKPGF
jgi:ligand-binding sensor domain-containing protein/signal transduction histidine kinase